MEELSNIFWRLPQLLLGHFVQIKLFLEHLLLTEPRYGLL